MTEYRDEWQIRDETGLIHFGNEYQMKTAMEMMVNHGDFENFIEEQGEYNDCSKEVWLDSWNEWKVEWEGYLELIQLHKVKYKEE